MCGIFAYVGSEPANIEKIKALGIYNVTRGSDACGIVINDKVEKGVNRLSNWTNFVECKKLQTHSSHTNYIILGHTRSASNKTTKDDIDCAHPINIKTKKGTSKLIGVHNGTITNHVSLSKKYNVKDGKIDSITLMNVLATAKENSANYKFFEEYDGAVTTLWYYPDSPNTLYIFKGGTKSSANENPEEERPLYVYEEVKDKSYYFSSIKESLYFIGGDINSVSAVPLNTVIKYKVGEKPVMKVINRNVIDTTTSTGGYYSNCNVPFTRTDSNVGFKKVKNAQQEVAEKHKSTFEGYAFSKYNQFAKLSGSKNYCLIENEPFILNQAEFGSKVYYWKGRYTRNGHIIGTSKEEYREMILDIYGFERDKSSMTEEDEFKSYYFFQGFLFKSKEHGDKYFEEAKKNPFFMWLDKDTNKLNYGNLAKYCFGVVTPQDDVTGNSALKTSYTETIGGFYSGTFTPMFDYSRTYEYLSGHFKKATQLTDLNIDTIIKVVETFEKQSIMNHVSTTIESKPIAPVTNPKTQDDDKLDNLFHDCISSMKALGDEIEANNKEKSRLLPILTYCKKKLFSSWNNIPLSPNPIVVDADKGLIYS